MNHLSVSISIRERERVDQRERVIKLNWRDRPNREKYKSPRGYRLGWKLNRTRSSGIEVSPFSDFIIAAARGGGGGGGSIFLPITSSVLSMHKLQQSSIWTNAIEHALFCLLQVEARVFSLRTAGSIPVPKSTMIFPFLLIIYFFLFFLWKTESGNNYPFLLNSVSKILL